MLYFCFFKIKERKNIIVCPNLQCKIRINIEELKGILNQRDIENYYTYSLEYYVDTHAEDVNQINLSYKTFLSLLFFSFFYSIYFS